VSSNPADASLDPWRTAITNSDDTGIWYRGYDVATLMRTSSFAEVVFLLHHGRIPTAGERRLIDAILIAVADHGPGAPSAVAMRTVATGNRQAPEAAIAAGVLAIGDAHGGAGLACLKIIGEALDRAKSDGQSLAEAADQVARDAAATRRRLPGFGHRTHSTDPRTVTLLQLAREERLAGPGVEFVVALERAVGDRIKPLPMNVDGAIAGVLYDLGFPPLVGKLIFIVGRVAGLGAQLVEEYTRERPMRVKVPVAYDGPAPRPLTEPEIA
jgi:citrate synthase